MIITATTMIVTIITKINNMKNQNENVNTFVGSLYHITLDCNSISEVVNHKKQIPL